MFFAKILGFWDRQKGKAAGYSRSIRAESKHAACKKIVNRLTFIQEETQITCKPKTNNDGLFTGFLLPGSFVKVFNDYTWKAFCCELLGENSPIIKKNFFF